MKKWYLGGCALLIVGAVLVGMGALMGAFTPVAIGEAINAELGETPEADEFTMFRTSVPAAEVNSLSIDLMDANAYILPVSGDEVTVEYFADKHERVTVNCENGKLSVTQSNGRNWLDYLHIDFGTLPEKKVTIYLPAALAGVDVYLSSGSVSVEGIEVSGNMDVVSSSGSLFAANTSVGGKLKVHTSSGSMSLNGVQVTGDIEADASSGSISMIMTEAGADMRVNTSSGGLSLENCRSRALSAGSTSGSIDVTSHKTTGEMNLSASSGSINVNSGNAASFAANTSSGSIYLSLVDAPEMTVTAISGSVKGTLYGGIGDYLVDSSTNSGDNSIPSIYSTAGNRKLTVSTSSGNIELDFAEK